MRRLLCALVACIAWVSVGYAFDARPLTPAEMERYAKVTHALVAPCCWREVVATHHSGEAEQMQGEIRQLILAGRSEEEIKSFYVARYGVRILADPPGPEGTYLYTVVFVLIAGTLTLALALVRFLLKREPTESPSIPPLMMSRILKEMNDARN